MDTKRNSATLEDSFPNICAMTSRDFHMDLHSRQEVLASCLKDGATMSIFEEVIRFNRHLFKGKLVLVLNAGIDLCFPLWAAKYGAKHVFAVDDSHALEYLKAIAEDNGMRRKITILKGLVQQITLVQKVDIIISNWMGYALLIEDKIRSVIYARDNWLKKDGVILPDGATLLVAGVQNSTYKNERIDWWVRVHDFNMSAVRRVVSAEPQVQKINTAEILTMPVKIWNIDLRSITSKELRFETSFYIEITQGGALEGLVTWFDVHFSKSHVPVLFSTSPWAPNTKWLQTVFYFDDRISVNVKERYHCGIKMEHCYYKDGGWGTTAYLELYSGPRSSLSLVFTRNWLTKWLYTDHTNGAEQLRHIHNRKHQSKANVADLERPETDSAKVATLQLRRF